MFFCSWYERFQASSSFCEPQPLLDEPGRTIWQVRQQKKETDISSVKIPILGISSSTSPETLLWEKLALNDGTVIRANITTDGTLPPSPASTS